MKKDKILRVCHKFLVDDDGYDLDVRDLCESTSKKYQNYVTLFLEKRAIQPYIKRNRLTRKDGMLYHAPTKSHVIPIEYEAKHGNYLKDLHMRENVISFQEQFKRILQEVEPDIVHIHGTLAPQFRIAAKHSRRGAKVIATHHIGLINQDYHNQSVRVLFLKYLAHNLMPIYCDKIICVSRHGKRSFLSKNKLIVINPVPKPRPFKRVRTDKILKKNVLKNGFCTSKGDRTLLCPARFHEQKNQLRLVKAFVEAAKKDEHIKLVMAGSVRDKRYFERVLSKVRECQAKKRICILPGLSNDELRSLLRQASCVITPSINEGFGRAAMEAVQEGIPAIASKDGGYADFIKDGRNGTLVNPYSARQIAQAINRISWKKTEGAPKFSEYLQKIMKIYQG